MGLSRKLSFKRKYQVKVVKLIIVICPLFFAVFHNVYLTDGIFETGAYRFPSKSQNLTVLGQGGPFSLY